MKGSVRKEVNMKVEKVTYGTLKKVTDLNGRPYDDWHREHVGIPGMILVFHSKRLDGKFLFFFPYEEWNHLQRHMRTSLGHITPRDGGFIMHTHNSIYDFDIDEGCLSNEEKFLLNTFAYRLFAEPDKA